MAKIIIVEDDALILDDLKNSLSRAGHTIIGSFAKGENALIDIEKEKPDLVLMDIKLEGYIDGIETAAIIKFKYNILIIYLTAFSNEKFVERSKQTEPIAYLLKPFSEEELIKAVDKALNK